MQTTQQVFTERLESVLKKLGCTMTEDRSYANTGTWRIYKPKGFSEPTFVPALIVWFDFQSGYAKFHGYREDTGQPRRTEDSVLPRELGYVHTDHLDDALQDICRAVRDSK